MEELRLILLGALSSWDELEFSFAWLAAETDEEDLAVGPLWLLSPLLSLWPELNASELSQSDGQESSCSEEAWESHSSPPMGESEFGIISNIEVGG